MKRLMTGICKSNVLKTAATLLLGVLLCLFEEHVLCNCDTNNRDHKAQIDVQETDGRYVIWREEDVYHMEAGLRFTCREGKFYKVLVSYDGGKTFCDETGRYFAKNAEHDRLIISSEIARDGPLCMRFLTTTDQGRCLSRDYMIN